MRILIFGGSGVISEYLASIAVNMQMEVYCYNRGNRKELIPKNVINIYGDCNNDKELAHNLLNYSFDVVIDFLSFRSGQLYSKLQALTGRTKQYIFISSASVYTRASDFRRKTEMDEKNNLVWDYSSDKIECEKLLQEYCTGNNIKYTIIRPHITYGNQRVPFQINSFKNSFSLINRLLLGKQIAIAGDGENYCTITHSEDLCRILIRLFLNPRAYDNDFHITSEEAFTWNQVLDIIGNTIGIMPRPIYLPVDFIEDNSALLKGSMIGDKARNMLFDNDKIKRTLGDKDLFHIRFVDGIKNVCNYMLNSKRFYEADMIWQREIDTLIDKFHRRTRNIPAKVVTSDADKMIPIDIYRRNYLSLERRCEEQEKNLRCLSFLTSSENIVQRIEAYFEVQGIEKIAIYGIGNNGKHFFERMKTSKKIKLQYLIDQNVKEYEGMKVLNWKDPWEEVDAIIITPITRYHDIMSDITQRCNYRIISLEDLIY